MKIDVLNSVRRIQNIYLEECIECFVAYEEEKLIGIVTKKELIGAHPNRIIADILSSEYRCIHHEMHLWEAAEVLNSNRDIHIFLVEHEGSIAGYITKAILNMELGKHIDVLTELYKSDYMFHTLYDFIKNRQQTTFLFIDLNNFGYIDKKYGHMNGDIILKTVANILRNTIDQNCRLCRYAGDEFAIVTPYCLEEGKLLAEKILKALCSYEFLYNIPVSAAIGIIQCNMENDENKDIYTKIYELINSASLASTKAKKESDFIYVERPVVNAII